MTRLLVAGVGPRPAAGLDKVYAPGLRLETISRVLIDAGHEVHGWEFVPADSPEPSPPPKGAANWYTDSLGVYDYESNAETIREAKPEAIVALTDGVAHELANLEFDGPLYIDYNGHPMVERQMQGARAGNDVALADQWRMVLPVLLRADRFGTCSAAQRLALIGELGAAGRLNSKTAEYEFVDVLRPPLPFTAPFEKPARPFLRGPRVPADARIILFTGGYNTWLDEESLFAAVEDVLAADPRAVYVSTGGGLEGHVTSVFGQYEERVAQSPNRDRYHFVGWLKHEEYEACCLEADVGVFGDLPGLEGELGCRNRLYGWLWGGMRAVATNLSEIVRTELGPAGLVHGVPLRDPEVLLAALREELERGRCDEAEAQTQRERLRELAAPEVLYRPLLKWASAPGRAPDREDRRVPQNPLTRFQGQSLQQDSLEEAAERLANRLEGSRAFRLYCDFNPKTAQALRALRAVLPRKGNS